MTKHRLVLGIEATKKPKWTGSLAIVPVARDECLRCGGAWETMSYGQLPLFRSHGYGAVRQTTLRVCTVCRASFIVDITEVNPRGYA